MTRVSSYCVRASPAVPFNCEFQPKNVYDELYETLRLMAGKIDKLLFSTFFSFLFLALFLLFFLLFSFSVSSPCLFL